MNEPQMVLKQVYIEERQNTRLQLVSEDRGVPEDEIVRWALEQFLNAKEVETTRQAAWRRATDFMRQWTAQGEVRGRRDWERADLYAERVGHYGS